VSSRRRALTRRGLFAAGGAGAASLALSACGDEAFDPGMTHAGDAPNVLLLITDSTRADYVGAWNSHALADTPNLDALAKESLRFSLAVPDSMPTGPARRCILSGTRGFPYRDWVPTKGLPLEPGWVPIEPWQPILTEVLGNAGISTGYATDNPFLVGPRFANFRRTLEVAKPDFSQGSYRFLNKPFKRVAARGAIDRYLVPELSDSVEVGRLRSMVGWNSIYRVNENDYSASRVIRKGMRALKDLKDERPFFLGVDAFDPHEAFDPPPAYRRRFNPEPKGSMERRGILPVQPFETPYSWVVDVDLDDDDIQVIRELYAAELTFVDHQIGRLLNRLDDYGLLDETVIYYLSDHGVTLGEHGIVGKHAARANWHIYHVPYMIRHPEGKLAGQVSDFFASTHDVARTVCSFMGVRAPGAMDGEDLSVLFEGREPPPRPYFMASYADYVLAGDRDWVLVSDSRGDRKRVYDKKKDPIEYENVADEHPEQVDRLWSALLDDAGGTLPQFGSKGVTGG